MGITPSANAVFAALSEVIYTRDLLYQAIDAEQIPGVTQLGRTITTVSEQDILSRVPRLTLGQEIDRLN